MSKTRVLITVTTYPLPSRSYDELVCTAGITENGEWIRIYPVPLKFLQGKKKDGKLVSFKYQWIEVELEKRQDDIRPESYSPKNNDFNSIEINDVNRIDTKNNWFLRKKICLQEVYYNKNQLLEDCRAPKYKSLVTFKPSKIVSFDYEEDEREWKDVWKEMRKQGDLFDPDRGSEIKLKKLPYKFFYTFLDDENNESRLMIEDWEIGALYWKTLADCEGNEKDALSKVRYRYEKEFINTKDIYLFLGTTKEWHLRKGKNPFVIIGVFYPKKESQLSLDL